jgi:hypothetical protein
MSSLYSDIVENKRCGGGKVVQRQLLYLGEINDSQHEGRKGGEQRLPRLRGARPFPDIAPKHRRFANRTVRPGFC